MNPAMLALIAARAAASSGPAFSDDFNRADSATTLGSPWTVDKSGTWGISSGQAYCVAVSDSSATVDIGASAGYTVGATFAYVDSNRFPAIVFRYVDDNNFYYAQLATSFLLRRMVNGANANLLTLDRITAGTVVSVDVTEGTGTEMAVYYNGVLQDTYTDTTAGRPAGSRVGLRALPATVGQFDNFTVTAL